MPRDAIQTTSEVESEPREVDYFCARCNRLVTKGVWELSINGGHEHVVFNPAGIVFRIRCFAEAPGAMAAGPASAEFTWFKGWSWRLAPCTGCSAHLGWRWEGEGPPPIFFGLIRDRLVERSG